MIFIFPFKLLAFFSRLASLTWIFVIMDWIVIVLKIKSVANYGYSSNIFFCATDAIADDTVRYKYVKKKGYVRLHTNKGDLNIELHCDKVNTFTNVEQNQPKK